LIGAQESELADVGGLPFVEDAFEQHIRLHIMNLSNALEQPVEKGPRVHIATRHDRLLAEYLLIIRPHTLEARAVSFVEQGAFAVSLVMLPLPLINNPLGPIDIETALFFVKCIEIVHCAFTAPLAVFELALVLLSVSIGDSSLAIKPSAPLELALLRILEDVSVLIDVHTSEE